MIENPMDHEPLRQLVNTAVAAIQRIKTAREMDKNGYRVDWKAVANATQLDLDDALSALTGDPPSKRIHG